MGNNLTWVILSLRRAPGRHRCLTWMWRLAGWRLGPGMACLPVRSRVHYLCHERLRRQLGVGIPACQALWGIGSPVTIILSNTEGDSSQTLTLKEYKANQDKHVNMGNGLQNPAVVKKKKTEILDNSIKKNYKANLPPAANTVPGYQIDRRDWVKSMSSELWCI